MSDIDLSLDRQGADLVGAIWEARRGDRQDLLPDVARLLDHPSPVVREEVISLIFVKWQVTSLRPKLRDATRSDPDFGVRSRAAGALALLTDDASRTVDCKVLRDIILNRAEEHDVRRACYEALARIRYGKPQILGDEVDLDEDVDLSWVHNACE